MSGDGREGRCHARVAHVGFYVDDAPELAVVSPKEVVALCTVQVHQGALTQHEREARQRQAPETNP